MKRTLIAATTMLLGTSALAAASAAQDKIVESDPVILAKYAQAAAMKPEFLSGVGGPLEVVDAKFAESDPIILAKYAQAADLKANLSTGMGGPFEEADSKAVETDPVVLAKYEQAAALKGMSSTGVGGPLEEATNGSRDLVPRPATDNYPPCDPGPGDDRCIQLYEPGVRAQLAGWSRARGGLEAGPLTTAVGGPYEPVDSTGDDSDLAMNADVDADASVTPSGDPLSHELGAHDAFAGTGGPIEAQSGYPPCSPGPGDDRCIQLYEAGVTGVGN